MDAQVLGFAASADQFTDYDFASVDRTVARAGDERWRLCEEIAVARRRVIAARSELAGAQDDVLRYVQAAQRVLCEEQQATARVVDAIASDADAEVARILGPAAARFGAPETRPAGRLSAEGPYRAHPVVLDADLPVLQSELDRLCTKADVLERQVTRAMAAPAGSVTSQAKLAVLERVLTDTLAVAREQHRRARGQATDAAEQRLAAARAQAEQLGSVGRTVSPGPWTDRELRREAPPEAPWPDERIAGQVETALPPSTELVLRPTADTRDAAAGQEVWRTDPPGKGHVSKPMILDIVLPLIAVAIVLLVVLSWIG